MHSVLQKLQFLFELPARLQKCLDMGAYAAAVSYYVKTKSVLHRYREMESFSGINLDCNNIIGKIIKRLKEAFHNKVRYLFCSFLLKYIQVCLQVKQKIINVKTFF